MYISLHICIHFSLFRYRSIILSIFLYLYVSLYIFLSMTFPLSFPLVFYFCHSSYPFLYRYLSFSLHLFRSLHVVISRSLYSFPAPSISLFFCSVLSRSLVISSISLSRHLYFSQSLSPFMLIVSSNSLLFPFSLYILFCRLS